MAEYAHGCDRGDEPMMASVYADSSRDAHGSYDGDGKEFARHVMNLIVTENFEYFHTLGQSLIKTHGDEAGVETYFIANGLGERNSLMDEFAEHIEAKADDAVAAGQYRVGHVHLLHEPGNLLLFGAQLLRVVAVQLQYIAQSQRQHARSYIAERRHGFTPIFPVVPGAPPGFGDGSAVADKARAFRAGDDRLVELMQCSEAHKGLNGSCR